MGFVGVGKEVGKFTVPVVGQTWEEFVNGVCVGVEFEHIDNGLFELCNVGVSVGDS